MYPDIKKRTPDNDKKALFLPLFLSFLIKLSVMAAIWIFFTRGARASPKLPFLIMSDIFVCQFDFFNRNRTYTKHTPDM
jgi:hypothetical protein